MVRLKIVSDARAGSSLVIQQFPCRIGRSASSQVRLEEFGVWDQHAELFLDESGHFTLKAFPNASVAVNGQTADQAVLKNGDLIEIGSVKLRFWLSETRQHSLRMRESLTWLCLAALCLAQVWIVYLLLR